MGKTNVCCPIPWDSHRNDIPMDKPGDAVLNAAKHKGNLMYCGREFQSMGALKN